MQRFFTLFFFLFYIHTDYRNGKFEGRGGKKKKSWKARYHRSIQFAREHDGANKME